MLLPQVTGCPIERAIAPLLRCYEELDELARPGQVQFLMALSVNRKRERERVGEHRERGRRGGVCRMNLFASIFSLCIPPFK